jgi:hypothetical protein
VLIRTDLSTRSPTRRGSKHAARPDRLPSAPPHSRGLSARVPSTAFTRRRQHLSIPAHRARVPADPRLRTPPPRIRSAPRRPPARPRAGEQRTEQPESEHQGDRTFEQTADHAHTGRSYRPNVTPACCGVAPRLQTELRGRRQSTRVDVACRASLTTARGAGL